VVRGSSADERAFLLLRISEPAGEPRHEVLSIDDYGARKRETISRLQLPIVAAAAKNEFDVRVQNAVNSLPDTFDVATRGGWFRGAFVFPNGEIVAPAGTLPSRKIRACLPPATDKYRVRGTLAGWQELCRPAEGNTSLMLSLALAFVGPLGELMGGDPPMFQLVGAAESGKSSIAIAAGSVWGEYDEGRRRSYVETWNNTGNNLEAIAAAHFGTFLVLDETGLADQSKSDNPYSVIKKTVLQLFQGEMKGRLTQVRRPKWWMGVLSTSNKSLDEMAVDSRTQCPETVRTRLIDVPVPLIARGAYEELHGFADEQALSVELKRIAAAHYGRAAREFVKEIVAWHKENPTDTKRWLAARREYYRKCAKPRIDSNGRKVDRVTEAFAAVYAAGCVAIEAAIVPWTRAVLVRALLVCQQAHEDESADKLTGVGRQVEIKEAWSRVKTRVRKRRENFVDLQRGLPRGLPDIWDDSKQYINKPKRGDLEYLFDEEFLVDACDSSATWDRLKRVLRTDGALVANKKRFVVKRQLCKPRDDGVDNRVWVYAIRAEAFEDESPSDRLGPDTSQIRGRRGTESIS